MRWMGAAEALRDRLVSRRPDPDLDALLLCALALLWPPGGQPYAPHTLVDESVKAARRLHTRHGGFVNAVLRRYLREQLALHLAVQADSRAMTNHQAWWVRQLRNDWGPRAEDLLQQAQ
jgi:16S rRNA (cytosine967-C5)-methyltransferase